MSQRPLKVGLVGGGGGAFIVHPHQRAIHFDGTRRVVCAALHPDPAVAMREAENWPYPLQGYKSYDEMIEAEAKKPLGQRIDYALIVTPNHVHFDPARKLLEAGIPVMCEKPMTITLAESDELARLVRAEEHPLLRGAHVHRTLDHPPLAIHRPQRPAGRDSLDRRLLSSGLALRTRRRQGRRPGGVASRSQARGASGCGGDIGTHALMQLRYCTGLEVRRLMAHLETFIPNRHLDDHFTVYAELDNGGRALIRTSQISVGHKNDCGIEIVGAKGSLRWAQEDAEKITIHLPGQPDLTYWRGCVVPSDGFLKNVPAELLAEITLPSGHVEAHHDAFARLHRCFEADVRCYNEGKPFSGDGLRYANVDDGRMGVYFILESR